MTKILFSFAGTGDSAKNIATYDNRQGFGDDVIRVYFNGCQDKAIGGSYLFGQLSPNLDIVGENVRSCFDDEGKLSIAALKKKFGNSIIIEPLDTKKDAVVEVESINLTGFSRGAVTTFAVARHLDDLGKSIQLFAKDPVPGESIDAAKDKDSQFARNYNLSECKNITKAQVVISEYRASVNMVHDVFFKQMAPIFNPLCDSHTYSAPRKHHVSASGALANQEIEFFREVGLTNGSGNLSFLESKDSIFFTPKMIAQVPHKPEAMKLELLPMYRKILVSKLSKIHNAPEQLNDRTLQALFALQQYSGDSSAKNALQDAVLNDHSPRGSAIKNFIIEFENVNQHALRKSSREKKIDAERDSLEVNSVVVNKFRESVYAQLLSLPLAPSAEDKKQFTDKTLEAIKELKGQIPHQKYKELKAVTRLFLSEHKLLTTDFSLSIQVKHTATATLSTESANHNKPNFNAFIEKQRDIKKTLHDMAVELKKLAAEEDVHSDKETNHANPASAA